MDFSILIYLLPLVSVLTALTVEALKKMFFKPQDEKHANIMAAIVSIVLSVCVCVAYMIIKNVQFTAAFAVQGVALAYFAWLSAMVGYDKVCEAISRIRKKKDDGSGEYIR